MLPSPATSSSPLSHYPLSQAQAIQQFACQKERDIYSINEAIDKMVHCQTFLLEKMVKDWVFWLRILDKFWTVWGGGVDRMKCGRMSPPAVPVSLTRRMSCPPKLLSMYP